MVTIFTHEIGGSVWSVPALCAEYKFVREDKVVVTLEAHVLDFVTHMKKRLDGLEAVLS
jgi:hypothetical protein